MARPSATRDSSAAPASRPSSEGQFSTLILAPLFGLRRQARLDHATLHGVVFDILLIRVLVRVRPARNDIGARQPAVQVDVAAALGTEWARGLGRRLAADRARLWLGGSLARAGGFGRISWHSASRSG